VIRKLNDRTLENFKIVMRRQTKTLQMLQPSKNVLQELKETVSAVNTTQNALEANDRIEKNIKKFIGVQISYKIH